VRRAPQLVSGVVIELPVEKKSFCVATYGIYQSGAVALYHDGALGLLRYFSGGEGSDARREQQPPRR
jgi:hypothetical protein